MKNFTPLLKLRDPSDKIGILYIMCIENRKKTYLSLKEKVDTKYWDSKKKRVKAIKEIDHVSLNQLIEDKIQELKATQTLKPNKNSFINYFKEYLLTKNSTGSKLKYEQVLNKIEKFQGEILFSDIDHKLIIKLQKFLLDSQSKNTSNHYLKLFKQVLDSAIHENLHTYYRHPFLGLKFKNEKVRKDSLSVEELKKLIDAEVTEGELTVTKNKFLFQIFSQGMRVSDLMLLRWSNISDKGISYIMYKTKTFMRIEINEILYHILIFQLRKFYIKLNINTPGLKKLDDELESLIEQRNQTFKNMGIESGFDFVEMEVPENLKIIDKREQIFISLQNAVHDIATQKKYNKNYIFDFIDFEIKNPQSLSEEEYKKFKNKSIVYNRHLKNLQKSSKISTNFKSHLSRHTYASLLFNDDVHISVIVQSLGHSSVKITSDYLSGFDNNKTGVENKRQADRFKY